MDLNGLNKCEFNMDNLSKPELLTLLSIMEGELEARDLVIEALRVRGDQADPNCYRPISIFFRLGYGRLEMEKLQLHSLEQEHRKLTAQLKDEREKNKHMVMMLVRECKQLATRVVEESQRFDEISARLDEESRLAGRLQEELTSERQRGQQMEAKMEKQLSELDTEREQLRARLGREETESLSLRRQVEQLRTERDGKDVKDGKDGKADPVSSQTASCQTDLPPPEAEGQKKPSPLTIPVKPTPTNYTGLSLPKTPSAGRGLVHSSSGGLLQTGENGAEGQTPHGGLHSPAPTSALPMGVSPRVQAARYKFQEQDQNGTSSQSSPPTRDLSPTNRDNFAAKQQARHTVTQVLSRFTSPPAGGPGALRPGLPHSTSEGGPFPGRLGHPIGLKSPTVARIDRGNPPPIPPKKPGLSQTPSPPHPPIKVVGDSSRSPGAGLKPGTPQLPPKPALDLPVVSLLHQSPILTRYPPASSCKQTSGRPISCACRVKGQ
uniref:Cortactin-binding protein-2 N-terminal domain-containing protein n=1 Tax=Salmo trutta TaxID=8032 RepID=A0A674CSP8_SALTR